MAICVEGPCGSLCVDLSSGGGLMRSVAVVRFEQFNAAG